MPESGSVGDEGSVGTASVASLGALNSTQTQGEEEFGDDEMGAEMANLREATARRNADENKLKKKTDQVEALKKLGNVARSEFNRAALKDNFAVGEELLKNVVRDRRTEIEKEERRFNVIYNSVTYFKRKAAKNLAELRIINEKRRAGERRVLEQCELDNHREIEAFDYEAYLKG